MIYGTSNGYIGSVIANNTSVEKGAWVVSNEEHSGGIQCLSTADITEGGYKDLIVGRDDGYCILLLTQGLILSARLRCMDFSIQA